MIIAIDFDGTCVTHSFPNVGEEIGAAPVLKKLVANGHELILFTIRSNIESPVSTSLEILEQGGNYLSDAIEWFRKHDIPLYGVQSNPSQRSWTTSPKAYAQMYIDDASLGCPLVYPKGEKPYIDWEAVERLLFRAGLIKTQDFISPRSEQ